MSKLIEAAASLSTISVGSNGKTEEKSLDCEVAKEEDNPVSDADKIQEKSVKEEDDKQDILKFTMLFNKYNNVLDRKRNLRNDEDKKENKYAMFFNKEVIIRTKPEDSSVKTKSLETNIAENVDKNSRFSSLTKDSHKNPEFHVFSPTLMEPQISKPGLMFSTSLSPSPSTIFDRKVPTRAENLKKFLNKRNSKVNFESLVQLNVHPTSQMDVRCHNSLTNLSKSNKAGSKGNLKSKIPSLTALNSNLIQHKSGLSRLNYWDYWDDLMLMQSDMDRRLNIQISRSSNDNNRRFSLKFKKEDAASVSDSKLLFADCEFKKYIKKCDKKSRGDSSRKERESGSRKQVQWKTEVDVIYFSTHHAANGDRTEEVIGRVMEPLREEWEQQRKGFYAKMVSSHMESHMKDRFISLLKI